MRKGAAIRLAWATAAMICLTIPLSAALARRGRNGTQHVHFYAGKYRVLFVDGQIEGRDATFILDTGSTITYMDIDALQINLEPEFVVPIQAANQRSQRRVFRLQLKLGDANLPGQFAEIDLTGTRQECGCQVVGLIGMDVLSRYSSVEIDFRDGVILLEP